MKRTQREIRNFLLMIAGGLGVAFIAVIGLVYYYGSSGTYLLRETLISPASLERVSFGDQTKKDDKRFVFNKIEFVRAEMSGQGWGRFAVSLPAYKEFYRLVSRARSIPHISDEVIAQYVQITPSTLTIFVRSPDNDGTIFQQVQFLDGSDVFRVQAREIHAQAGEWIYFSHPGIYQEVLELFAPTLQ